MKTIRLISYSISAILLVWMVLSQTPVQAGPITGGAGVAPFTKLGVYQGVVSVISSGTNAGLELGNLGRDIASTQELYLRPGAVAHANGVSITRNGNTADIHLNGKLCLYQHVGNVLPNGVVPDCRDVWPGGAGAASNWNLVSNVVDYYTLQSGNNLQPKNLNYGVHIGSVASPVTAGTAVSLDGAFFTDDLDVTNTGTGAAISAQGRVDFVQSAYVANSLFINGQEAWYQNREGEGSGLDADLLNGNNVTLENATSCTDDNGPRGACVCFSIYRLGSFTKHCAALQNE